MAEVDSHRSIGGRRCGRVGGEQTDRVRRGLGTVGESGGFAGIEREMFVFSRRPEGGRDCGWQGRISLSNQ